MRYLIILLIFCFSCQGQSSNQTENAPDSLQVDSRTQPSDTLRFEFTSFEEGQSILKDLNYTHERWVAGVREIPNIHIMKIPKRWRDETADHLQVQLKKEVFFEIIAPLVLSINNELAQDRAKILAYKKTGLSNLSIEEKDWLLSKAIAYKVAKDGDKSEATHLEELFIRIDEIPISLALAQSAEESGWGTSRFAAEGNALFGQWAWGENAMKPKEQRSGMGDYGLARFETPMESMRAYMHNLNTHRAYEKLRAARANLREMGKKPDGVSLAKTLDKYSERGEAYVETLLSIMRVNHLSKAEEAYLVLVPVILLIPKE